MQSGRKAPSPNAISQYAVNQAGAKDVVYQPLYDYQTYAAAGQTSLSFFQNPIGQSGKTLADTNMSIGGSLPAPQMFIVSAICIDFFPGNDVNFNAIDATSDNLDDVYTFMKSGYLDFTVGTKSQLQQAPLGCFPPTYRLGGTEAVTGTNLTKFAGADYASVAGQIFSIIPVTIPATQNFIVTLNWPSAVAINSAARVGVKLMGDLYRSVQ